MHVSVGKVTDSREERMLCVWQVNLDFVDEADMVQMARLGIALQPIATALFANSPFRDGKPTGYLSWRSHVWTDTVRLSAGMTNPTPGVSDAFSNLSAAASTRGAVGTGSWSAASWNHMTTTPVSDLRLTVQRQELALPRK